MLKIIILVMFFELEEVNKRYELRKFLRVEDEVKLSSVCSFMSKFEAEQFINFVFSVLNCLIPPMWNPEGVWLAD